MRSQCILFIRDVNSKGQEVSGYIDYAHRLATEKFEVYFEGKKKLMPKPSDLSYFNWETHASTSKSSPNFQVCVCACVIVCPWPRFPRFYTVMSRGRQVIADNEAGLLFKNKRDRKVINVDPKVCDC